MNNHSISRACHANIAVLFGAITSFCTLSCGERGHPPPAIAPSASKESMRPLGPPPAPVRPFHETLHGTTVADPYRWMEDEKDAEYAKWLSAQNDHARRQLQTLPGRAALAVDIRTATKGSDELLDVRRGGGATFLLRKPAGEAKPRLYIRTNGAKDERLLFPSGGEETTLDAFSPSPDGRAVALVTSSGGTEARTISVMNLADRKQSSERIDRVRDAGLQWTPEGSSFTYTRYPVGNTGEALARYKNATVYLHAPGTPVERDKAVFGFGALESGTTAPEDYPTIAQFEGSPWVVGVLYHGVLREVSLFVKRASDLAAGTKWRKFASPDDEVTEFAVLGDDLYYLTFRGSPRGRLMRVRADAPLATAVAVPGIHPDDVLEQLYAAKGAVLAIVLRRGIHRLIAIGADGTRHEAGLPDDSSVEAVRSRGSERSALLRVESYVQSPVWFEWSGGSAPPVVLSYSPAASKFEGISVRRTEAVSIDGTRVPITLLVPGDPPRNRRQPVWLLGYGAGGYTLTPEFLPFRAGWLKRGGIIALAHVRGGGELGAEWHRAAMQGKKETSIDDYLACADALIREGWTSSQALVANGGSAGAIVAGGAMTRRPELFRAVVFAFPAANMLRLDTLPVGAENAKEFGSASTPEGFEALRKMDLLQRVRDGDSYPAVLIAAGANDPRLPTWQSGKLAARLQAASTSGKPVLLTIAAGQGHGGDDADQLVDRYADAYAFALWQIGHPEFQPTASP